MHTFTLSFFQAGSRVDLEERTLPENDFPPLRETEETPTPIQPLFTPSLHQEQRLPDPKDALHSECAYLNSIYYTSIYKHERRQK